MGAEIARAWLQAPPPCLLHLSPRLRRRQAYAPPVSNPPAVLSSVGIDIIEIERMRDALHQRPRLAGRLFTARERAYCDRRSDPAPHYAARFAAKEATAKAIGRWLRWHDVEVTADSQGRPGISAAGEAAALARVSEGGRLLVSLSHSRDYAVACVVLVSPQETQDPT